MMRFLNDTSIRIKVLLVPLILVLALISVSLLAIYGLDEQHTTLSQVNNIALERITLVNQFTTLSEQVQSDVFRISVLRSMNLPQEEIQPFQARLVQGLSDLNVLYGQMLIRWSLDSAERTLLERMKGPLDAFRAQAQQAAVVVMDNPSFGVLLVRSSTVPFAEFRQTLADFLDYQEARIVRVSRESDQRARMISVTLIGAALLIALAATLTTMWLSARLISAPIRAITGLMHRLAQGDLSIEVAGLYRRDEIGEMAQAVEVFRNNAIEKARLDKELQESEARYRQLVDLAPIAISVYQQSKVVFVNPAAIHLVGATSATDLVGKPMLDFVHPDFRDLAMQRVRTVLAGDVVPLAEERFLRLDGSIMDVEVLSTPIIYAGQSAAQAIILDITERKQAEDRARMFAAELARSNRELEQFASVVAHDLQEPLRMVASYVDLLAKRYRHRLDADADEFIAFMSDGAERMQRLITDLLSYARVSKRDKAFAEVNCETAFSQALDNLQVAIAESQAVVTHDPLPTVLADESQLVQLFQNLIGNALKFRGADPPRVHIAARIVESGVSSVERGELVGGRHSTLHAPRSTQSWEFSIRDNGIGFDPQLAERIFVIFQRLHGRAEYPGTGIGLAICKRIVERHGGRIWAASEPGQGATFWFTIPV